MVTEKIWMVTTFRIPLFINYRTAAMLYVKYLIRIFEMKKSLFVVVLCMLCAVTFVGLNTEQETNDLLLMNVEALASGESDVPIRCFAKGSVDCPGMGVKVKYVTKGWSLGKDR